MDKYTVGIVCALTVENVAVLAFLDQTHDGLETQATNDNNSYTLGEIGKHNVVVAALPDGEYGISSAASVARDMIRSFTNIRIALMVGIGGGAPSKENDIRLGDVVVSSPRNGMGGVLQYDFGKTIQSQGFSRTGFLDQPPAVVRTAVGRLKARHEIDGHDFETRIESILSKKPRLRKKYGPPGPNFDILYQSDYIHDEHCCRSPNSVDQSNIIARDERGELEDNPKIHYGLIASANTLMKDALIRDRLVEETGVLCFEMEAAGLMSQFPFLIIRGICDYSDTHKNKVWQGYAAMAAAAYASALLCNMAPSQVDTEKKIGELVLQSVSKTEKVVEQLQSTTNRNNNSQILEWLTPINYGPRHSDIIKLREPGTGQWFLDSEEYRAWVSDDQVARTLLCPGIPGAGKTMVSSIVVEDLLARTKAVPAIGVAFAFFNYKVKEEQDIETLLCCLLKQLASSLENVPESVRAMYDQHQRRKTRPSLKELSTELQRTVIAHSTTYVVIDALDECEDTNGSRNKFLDNLFDLQEGTGTKLLFTSRIVPEIVNRFDEIAGVVKVSIIADNGDVQKYIHGRKEQIPEFIREDASLLNEVISGIASAVDGMFLLAKLHLDSLQYMLTIKTVRISIENISKRDHNIYDEAYENALQRIQSQPSEKAQLAMKMILWITHSKRQLFETELRYALSVTPGSDTFQEDDLVRIDLVSICAGLVVLDSNTGIIRLVHYTTQEFFDRTNSTRFPNAHNIISETCITSLSHNDLISEHLVGDLEFWLCLSPFLGYAAEHWGDHVLESYNTTPIDDAIVMDFLCKDNLVLRAAEVLQWVKYRRRGPGYFVSFVSYREVPAQFVRGTHLAAFFGLPKNVFDMFSPRDVDVQDHMGKTPLHWAVEADQAGAALALLDRGASTGIVDLLCSSPLSHATRRGNQTIVQLLIDWDATIDCPDNNGLTPLAWAARNGHQSIVCLLVDRGAAIDTLDHRSQTPLSLAAEAGYQSIVKFLVDRGAATARFDCTSRTPLSLAAAECHQSIVKMFADRGAAINTISDGLTPLSRAAGDSYVATVPLLADRGSAIDSPDRFGLTPLSISAAYGHVATVQLLADRGAATDFPDRSGRTPLSRAAELGHVAVVQLLADRGARIDTPDKNGKSPLSLAKKYDHDSVVRLLSRMGAAH